MWVKKQVNFWRLNCEWLVFIWPFSFNISHATEYKCGQDHPADREVVDRRNELREPRNFLPVASKFPDLPSSLPTYKAWSQQSLYYPPVQGTRLLPCTFLSSPVWKSSLWFLLRIDFYSLGPTSLQPKGLFRRKRKSKKQTVLYATLIQRQI